LLPFFSRVQAALPATISLVMCHAPWDCWK
jgi:hypothetical protein